MGTLTTKAFVKWAEGVDVADCVEKARQTRTQRVTRQPELGYI